MSTLIMSDNYELQDYEGLNPVLPSPLDATMLRTYAQCPSKFYYAYVLGLRKRSGGESSALAWGTLWHLMHETYNETQDIEITVATVEAQWPHHVLNETDPKGRTYDRMIRLFLEYRQKFDSIDAKEWETVRQEQYFEVECKDDDDCPFGGCGLHWCGRIDRIARRRGTKLYAWDYKTTSYLRNDFFDVLEHGYQMRGYAWLARHVTDAPVAGVFIDMLHCLKNKDEMHRREIRLTDHQLAEWVREVRMYVDEIQEKFAKWPDDPTRWRKNWEHCSDYGGCQFKDVDYAADIRDTRLRILSEYYVEDRWNPADPTRNDADTP